MAGKCCAKTNPAFGFRPKRRIFLIFRRIERKAEGRKPDFVFLFAKSFLDFGFWTFSWFWLKDSELCEFVQSLKSKFGFSNAVCKEYASPSQFYVKVFTRKVVNFANNV